MDIKDFVKIAVAFRDKRDWKKFHTPKDSALALMSEVGELIDRFKWYSPEELGKYISMNREKIGEDLAAVMFWVLLMSNDFKVDLEKAYKSKMKKNEEKYPVKKWKSKHI